MEKIFNVIVDEMTKGNFSFAILIVGLLQLIIMIATYISNHKFRK